MRNDAENVPALKKGGIINDAPQANSEFAILSMTDWVLTILLARSFSAGVLSLLEPKHLVICNREVVGTCEERALLSWWALIGVAEIAATKAYVCIIWYI